MISFKLEKKTFEENLSMEKFFDKKLETADFPIVKHNTLVESSYDLSPVPNNIMTIAMTKARQSNVSCELWNGEVIISAQEYAKIHKVSLDDAYKVLKRAVLELEETKIICDAYYDFSNGEVVPEIPPNLTDISFFSESILASKPKHGKFSKMKLHIRLVQKIGYSDTGSFIYLKFSDDILHLIKNATNPDALDYTQYDYANTIELNTTPAKRLYELVCKWRKVGNCRKQVDEWKILFGVFAKYPNVAEFKRRVLQPAMNQVNEQGEFKLTLEQDKLGRSITHFNIIIEEKMVVENPTETTEFFAKASNVNLFESLSETERQTVKAIADKYIAKNQINDETHKRNIYKKAINERWGLLELDNQNHEYQRQSEEVKKKLEANRLSKLEKQQEILRKEQESKQFVQLFESLDVGFQIEVLDRVRNLIATEVPVFLKMFDKENDKKSAHTDIRFRSYFKRIMAIE